MGSHPINLGLRFTLEVIVLVSTGVWGYRQMESWPRYILAFAVPCILALIWVTFAVPDDPSRSGNAPVVTPGIIRLGIELAFFAFAIWALYDNGSSRLSFLLGVVVMIHYIISYDRIIWLWSH